ncbi:sugar phosphate isomerase [Halarchaeum grantii]|uniref:Sugar phosphate isomerase n=1 Tax=Halarchaeum grantii TaxID=1193105 RepID=A0A830FBU4_9EURY|nr:sugar phosphate isomerase/epimerase [Halarchaeum grantii]GGL39101.1 sugar phosphate isomerase [Halarchaeum grantii]
MTNVGFQLYSLHAVDDPLPAVVERVGETGFGGVEFAGLDGASVAALTDALDAAGLDAAGAHVALDDIEADPAGVAETYRALGCTDVAVPWLDPEHFASAEAVEATGERLDAAARALDEHGLTLHYHNHDQELVEVDGRHALDYLADVTDVVGLQPDLGWIGAGGGDPLAFLDAHADRIDQVHLKDYVAGEPGTVKVGDGDIDIAAVVEACREHGFSWLIYEAEERPDSYETLAHADAVVERYW